MTRFLPLVKGYGAVALKHPGLRRAAWAALGLVAADLLLFASFFGPAAWRHLRLEEEIAADRRARLEALHDADERKNYDQLTQRAGVLEAKWRKPADQSALVQSLARLTRECGLKVVSQDFDVEDARDGGKIFKRNLTLTGAYPALRRFLREIGQSPNLTVVEQARLERAGEKGGNLRSTLELWTFSRPTGREAP